MSFKMNFSFSLSELIQAWQVAYLANWVDSKSKPFLWDKKAQKDLFLSPQGFSRQIKKRLPGKWQVQNKTCMLFQKEDHRHTKSKLINVAFWKAQPLYDFPVPVAPVAFK